MRRLLECIDNILSSEESEERHLLDKQQTNEKIPVNNAGFVSYLFMSWMTPLVMRLYKQRKKEIKEEDVWHCSDLESVAYNTKQLEICWQQELNSYGERNSSFLRAWLKFSKTRLLILILGLSVNTIASFWIMGYLTELIVSYLESDESDTLYAFGLLLSSFVGQIIRACSLSFSIFFGGHMGIRFRAGVMGLAYKKLMKLKTVKGDTSSEIITIFGSDSLKVFMNCQTVGFILAVPLYLIPGIAYTYYLIGPWCFVAFGVFFFAYQFQTVLAAVITSLRRTTLVWTDKRIRLMTEVLKSMKVIKMYAWEESFVESIKCSRNKETKYLKISSVFTLVSSGIIPVTPTLASVATIAVYAAFGNHLQSSTAFSVVSILNFLRVVVTVVPLATRIFGETRVSFERIKRLLLKEEYKAPSKNTADTSNAIEIDSGVFEWDSESVLDESCGTKLQFSPKDEQPTSSYSLKLKAVDLTIKKGKLIGICGSVGCGKSSLVTAILGRMPLLSGHLAVDGSVAYASQQAWIFNGSLKDNVVFGSKFDSDWYKRVIYACGLQPDLELFQNGDQTEIGDRGINISGGQKQRISLARAVYSKSDIYLLDDPLSAVDVHVGKHLFHECINTLLKEKTVILVTHQLQYLEHCDEILVMGDGEIVEHGTYQTLLNMKGRFTSMIKQFNLTINHASATETFGMLNEQGKTSTVTIEYKSHEDFETKSKLENGTKGKGGDLTKKEKVEIGSVRFETYKSYINAAGGICISTVVFLLYVATVGAAVFSDWWLGIWIHQTTIQAPMTADITYNISMQTEDFSSNASSGNINTTSTTEFNIYEGVDFYIIIYVGSLVAVFVFAVMRGVVSGTVLVGASESLHDRILKRIMKAPMSYFDANPPGRILNRFSRDIEESDVYIPTNLDSVLHVMLTIVMSVASTVVTLPWFLIALIPVVIAFNVIKRISAVSILQLKRLENKARSPLLSHVATTGQGLSTIVAFKQQDAFVKRCMEYADLTSAGLFLLDGSIRWTGLRLDLLASLMTGCATVVVVCTRGVVPTALASLGLLLCIKVTSLVQYLIRMMNELESRFTSVERLHEYESLETEKEASAVAPNETWPSEGHVTFTNVVMKYRNDMDPALCNVNFDILPKQKVGIVGRTGAGKSSLVAALFRLADICSGLIYIDGVDIGLIPQKLLRSKISAIPQDPVLFAGTLRYNLDPIGKHSEVELWSALEQAHIKEKMQLLDMNLDLCIEENGENLSVGERQLICLARAILRKNKVLVLDEATASIDTATDTLIQQTIRDSFSDCTVLTIAHRLNTVLNCDVIFVMETGRIIERGEPRSLLSNSSSHFYKMVRSQNVK